MMAARPTIGTRSSAQQIAQALLEPDARPVISSHHNPDADAIGSMLGLARALRAAGQSVVLAHADGPVPPSDLAFLLAADEQVLAEPPGDLAERTLVTVDCASEKRLWPTPYHERAGRVINIDHHQDNTHFGHLNLVVPHASSTAEVLLAVIDALGVELTEQIANPLYAGMVTDTGRFGYSNTSAQTHRQAARLLDAGVNPSSMNTLLYEEQPVDRLLLMGRALSRAQVLGQGRMICSSLTRDDIELGRWRRH